MSIETPSADADLRRARAVLAALDDAALVAVARRVAQLLGRRLCRPGCRAAARGLLASLDEVAAHVEMARDHADLLTASLPRTTTAPPR